METDPKLIKRHLDQIISSHKQSENNKVKAGKKHAGPLKNSNKKPVWYSTDRKKINKKSYFFIFLEQRNPNEIC